MIETTESTTSTYKLYVGNLPFSMDETDIEGLCATCGEVTSVALIRDRETQRSKGFSFVEFGSKEDMENALERLNGHVIQGRTMRVSVAKERDKPAVGNGKESPLLNTYYEKFCSLCKTRKPVLVGYSEGACVCADCSRAVSKAFNRSF